jgi:hypothetical protein
MRSRSLLFWDVTQRSLVVSYGLFGTANWSHLHGSSSPDQYLHPIDCLEMSVSNYKPSLCNMPEERRPHLQRGESVDSSTCVCYTDVHKCPRNVVTTSTFQGPEGCHEAFLNRVPKNIKSNPTKFSRLTDMSSGICATLMLHML